MPWHIIGKLLNAKDKRQILNAVRRETKKVFNRKTDRGLTPYQHKWVRRMKWYIPCAGRKTSVNLEFYTHWNYILRTSEILTFSNQQKTKSICHQQNWVKETLKNELQAEGKWFQFEDLRCKKEWNAETFKWILTV